MEVQTLRLSLKPDDYAAHIPVVYCNQYDEGRTYTATITDVDGSAYTFSNETAVITGTKPDGTGFSYTATCSGNTVSFTLTGQMSVVSGWVRCGIVITKGTTIVGTLVFRLYVQAAALTADTIISTDSFDSIISDAVSAKMDEMHLVIDDTLTTSGAAADAKVTGDEIGELKSHLSVSDTEVFGSGSEGFPLEFEAGTYRFVNTGMTLEKYTSGEYLLTRKVVKSTTFTPPCVVKLTAKTGYVFSVYLSTDGVIDSAESLITEYSMEAGQQYGMILRSESGEDDISAVAVSDIIDIEYVSRIDHLEDETLEMIDKVLVTDGVWTANGLTIERVSDCVAKIYGTANETRRMCFFNGDHVVRITTTAFSETLAAGEYETSLTFTGHRTTSQIVMTYNTFASNYKTLRNGYSGVITCANPVMIGLTVSAGNDYGTEDDPTYIEFHMRVVGVKGSTEIYKALDTKANQDGYYEELTAGSAEQLVSTTTTTDTEPYLFRAAGGSADIGNRVTDTIVGGTLGWNQLINPNASSKTTQGVTFTKNDDGSWTISGTPTAHSVFYNIDSRGECYLEKGHIYLISGYSGYDGVGVGWCGSGASSIVYTTKRNRIEYARNPGANTYVRLQVLNLEGVEFGPVTVIPQLFDLTAIFGTEIAEYIYGLEAATTGAGEAWFRKYFPEKFYPYAAPALQSVSGLVSHDTVEFNAYNHDTKTAKVLGGHEYKIEGAYTALSLDGETITPDSGVFTPSKNGTLTVTGGDNTTTCVHLRWSGYRDGEFEPYSKHSYPLDSSVTLMGTPILDSSGNLRYAGDTYASDGVVTRRYRKDDMGTLSWTKYESTSIDVGYYFGASVPAKSGATSYANHFHQVKYVASTERGVDNTAAKYGSDVDKVIFASPSSTTNIYVIDSDYSDAESFTAAMSGIELVYRVPNSYETKETAEPFANPQIVDDFGTEEYVTTDSIVPVGHSSEYMVNLRDKLQHLPDMAESDGTYLISQSNNQMALTPYSAPRGVPDAPTTDGTYILKATVTDGTATYSWEAAT